MMKCKWFFPVYFALTACLNFGHEYKAENSTHWVEILPMQTPESAIFFLKNKNINPPVIEECAEIVFESDGCDVISESQFTIIIKTVINSQGKIEKYKVIHKPSFLPDFTDKISQALSKWLFKPAQLDGKNVAVYKTMAFPKKNGAAKTSICEKFDMKSPIVGGKRGK